MRGLVRAPSASIVDCELTHRPRVPIDVELLYRQHGRYVSTLQRLGVKIEWLPPLDRSPDAVFVEDAAVVLDEVSIVCNPGAESRRGEPRTLAPHLPADRPALRAPADESLDGGDVLVVGRNVLVGRSTRTAPSAARWIHDALTPLGYRVASVPVERALHLKTAVTLAGPGCVVVDPLAVDEAALRTALPPGTDWIAVSPHEAPGANVLRVGPTTLVAASAPETAARLRHEGLRVSTLDISEFEKAEAGLTCLSIVFDRR